MTRVGTSYSVVATLFAPVTVGTEAPVLVPRHAGRGASTQVSYRLYRSGIPVGA